MRYLTLAEVLELHRRIIEQSGGADGVRDLGGLESAITQPQMSFAETKLYPSIVEAATALCYSLVMDHTFVDGNKRIGHAAMEIQATEMARRAESQVYFALDGV